MRWYVMYRTWCRWDGYAELKSENVTIDNEAVTMYFVRAKNDQYYSGTTCILQKILYSTGKLRDGRKVPKSQDSDTLLLRCFSLI